MVGKRRPNFNADEIEKLKQEYVNRKKILKGKFATPGIANRIKEKEWEKVAVEVNKVGSSARTGAEVKRKWENLKTGIKSKLAGVYKKGHMRKTGGGSPTGQVPTGEADRMLAIIGKSSVLGITAGVDSSLREGAINEKPVTGKMPGLSAVQIQEMSEDDGQNGDSSEDDLQDEDILGTKMANDEENGSLIPSTPSTSGQYQASTADRSWAISVLRQQGQEPISNDFSTGIQATPKPAGSKTPKSISEKLLIAQHNMCDTLKCTNEILAKTALGLASSFEKIVVILERMADTQEKLVNLPQSSIVVAQIQE